MTRLAKMPPGIATAVVVASVLAAALAIRVAAPHHETTPIPAIVCQVCAPAATAASWAVPPASDSSAAPAPDDRASSSVGSGDILAPVGKGWG